MSTWPRPNENWTPRLGWDSLVAIFHVYFHTPLLGEVSTVCMTLFEKDKWKLCSCVSCTLLHVPLPLVDFNLLLFTVINWTVSIPALLSAVTPSSEFLNLMVVLETSEHDVSVRSKDGLGDLLNFSEREKSLTENYCRTEIVSRWHSRRTCSHSLFQEHQNHN